MSETVMLLGDIPVAKRHGMSPGSVHHAIPTRRDRSDGVWWWVEADSGYFVGVKREDAVAVSEADGGAAWRI